MSLLVAVMWHNRDFSYYQKWNDVIGQYLNTQRLLFISDLATPFIPNPRLIVTENNGIGAKRHHALSYAREHSYDYLLMLDDNVIGIYHFSRREENADFIEETISALRVNPSAVACGFTMKGSPEMLGLREEYQIINSFALNKCYMLAVKKINPRFNYDISLERFGEDIDFWINCAKRGYDGLKLRHWIIHREVSEYNEFKPLLDYTPYVNMIIRHADAIYGWHESYGWKLLPDCYEASLCNQCYPHQSTYPPTELSWNWRAGQEEISQRKRDHTQEDMSGYNGDLYNLTNSDMIIKHIDAIEYCHGFREDDRRTRSQGKRTDCYEYNRYFRKHSSNKYARHWVETVLLYFQVLDSERAWLQTEEDI